MRYASKAFWMLVGFGAGALAGMLAVEIAAPMIAERSGASPRSLGEARLVGALFGGVAIGWVGYNVAERISQLLRLFPQIALVRYWILGSACWSMLVLMLLLWGVDLFGAADPYLPQSVVVRRVLVLWLGPPLFSIVALSLWTWARAAGGQSESP